MTLDIPYYRLQNQHLLQEKLNTPAEVVNWLGAVQSQDYAGAKWAIGLRTNGLTETDVDRAFADGSILRTHLLRPTWHFVTPADIRWMLALTAPRVHALNAFMYRKMEVDKPALKKSYGVLEKSLRAHNYSTREQLGSAFEKAGVRAQGQRLAYIVMSAELDGIICSGPRKGKQFTYALLEERATRVKSFTRDESLAELAVRYFQSHGPASLQDFCVWSGLTMADARDGMEMVKAQFLHKEMDGQTYWFRETKLPARKKTPTAYLLPNYDELFIGFKDRSAIGKVAQQAGIEKDDPSFLAHIIILEGQVVGGWRRMLNRNEVLVEASLFTKLTNAEEGAIADAVESFGKFLGLPIALTFKEHNHEQRKTRSF